MTTKNSILSLSVYPNIERRNIFYIFEFHFFTMSNIHEIRNVKTFKLM